MAAAGTFGDLLVLRKVDEFVLAVYRVTASFPKYEVYGLIIQICGAAASISENIAEGLKKKSKRTQARFMNAAQSSVEECRYCLILAKDLGYGETGRLIESLEEISHLLKSYTEQIRASGF